MKIDADGAWKDVRAEKLPLAFELLSPEAHGAVDWAADYEPLDAELRRLTADVQFWVRCLDRLLPLRGPRQREIWDRLEALDTEQDMAFVSYAEQRGLEKGIEQGIEKGLEQGIGQGRRESLAAFLRARYRAESAGLLDLLKAAPEARLAALCDEVFAADSLDAVRAALSAPTPP